MARVYGRAKRGKRCRAAVPHGHWKTTTFTGALRCSGMTAPMVLDGPMNAAAFRAYVLERYMRTARVQIMARVYGEVYHASGVNRELRNKVLREWTEQGGVDMSWLYGDQPELPYVDNVPMPPATRLAS